VLPVVATIKIISEHTQSMKAVAYLISNQQERKYLVRKRRAYYYWSRFKATWNYYFRRNKSRKGQ